MSIKKQCLRKNLKIHMLATFLYPILYIDFLDILPSYYSGD